MLVPVPFHGRVQMTAVKLWGKQTHPGAALCVSDAGKSRFFIGYSWSTQPAPFSLQHNFQEANPHIPAVGSYNTRNVIIVKKYIRILQHELKFLYLFSAIVELEKIPRQDTK